MATNPMNYGALEEEKKKRQQQVSQTVPTSNPADVVMHGTITGRPSPGQIIGTVVPGSARDVTALYQAPKVAQPAETLPTPVYRPRAGEAPGFGYPSKAITATGEDTQNRLLSGNQWGRTKALNGMTLPEFIGNVSSRFGGVEDMRARSTQTSGSSEATDSASKPYLGPYMENLLQRGPSNRLENIILRRYYGNVGQESRSAHRAASSSEQNTLGVSPVPDMMRDVLSAENIAENINLDSQAQALNNLTQQKVQAAGNQTQTWNQAVQAGSSLMQNETTNLTNLMMGRGGSSSEKAAPAWGAFQQMIDDGRVDVFTDGKLDQEKMKAQWELYSGGLPSAVTGNGTGVIGGRAVVPGISGTLPQGRGQVSTPGGRQVELPPSVQNEAQRNGWTYVKSMRKGRVTRFVFQAPDGSIQYRDLELGY